MPGTGREQFLRHQELRQLSPEHKLHSILTSLQPVGADYSQLEMHLGLLSIPGGVGIDLDQDSVKELRQKLILIALNADLLIHLRISALLILSKIKKCRPTPISMMLELKRRTRKKHYFNAYGYLVTFDTIIGIIERNMASQQVITEESMAETSHQPAPAFAN